MNYNFRCYELFDFLYYTLTLILYVAYGARHGVPYKLVGRHGTVGCYLFSLFPAYVLAHPFACCFRRQNQRPAVVNIDQPLIGRSGHYQNPSASSPRSKGTLPIAAMNIGRPSAR